MILSFEKYTNAQTGGIVYGVIGKIQFFPGADWRLIVISKQTHVGNLPVGHEVYT